MMKITILFVLLWHLALTQRPHISRSGSFPEKFVVRQDSTPFTVYLDSFFAGFNLTFNHAPPRLEMTKRIPFVNQKARIQPISPTSVTVEGHEVQYVVLNNNQLDFILDNGQLCQFAAINDRDLECYDILAPPDDIHMLMACYNHTSSENINYLIELGSGKMFVTSISLENFSKSSTQTRREYKAMSLAPGGFYHLYYFYHFSVNTEGKEWLIQEFIYMKSSNQTWVGKRFSHLNSSDSPLQSFSIGDFVAFENMLVLYDYHQKALITFDKKSVLSSKSLRDLTSSPLELISMYGELNNLKQLILNLQGEVLQSEISDGGKIVKKYAYPAITCSRVLSSAMLNNELYMVCAKQNQNRVIGYKIGMTDYQAYFASDNCGGGDHVQLLVDVHSKLLVRLDSQGITFSKLNAQKFEINASWSNESSDYELIITSQNSLAKEINSSYPEKETRKLKFQIVFREANDLNIHKLSDRLDSVSLQYPNTGKIDLEKIFDGPALQFEVNGIPNAKVNAATKLKTNETDEWSRTFISRLGARDVLVLQEKQASKGYRIRISQATNINGELLDQTLRTEIELKSSVMKINSEFYPNLLILTNPDHTLDGSSHEPSKLYAVNLMIYSFSFRKVIELTGSLCSLRDCNAIHFSNDPSSRENIYCLDPENQKLSIYHYNDQQVSLTQGPTYQGPKFWEQVTLPTLTDVDTHSDFPGVLLLKFDVHHFKLGFYSLSQNSYITSLHIGRKDYLIQAKKLFLIDYKHNTIQVIDLHYLDVTKTETTVKSEAELGISGGVRYLDTYGCNLIPGSAIAPKKSKFIYIRAKCQERSSLEQIFVYHVENRPEESLRASLGIPLNSTEAIHISVLGGMYDNRSDCYDLILAQTNRKNFYHALYSPTNIIFDTKLIPQAALNETLNTFDVTISAKSALSSEKKVTASVVVYVAKFQKEIHKIAQDNTKTLPIPSYLERPDSENFCMSFDPYLLWRGSILEIESSVNVFTVKERVDPKIVEMQLIEKYKVHNRLEEKNPFRINSMVGFKLIDSDIYFYDTREIYVASKAAPEKTHHVLPLSNNSDDFIVRNIEFSDKGTYFVSFSRNNHSARVFQIQSNYTLFYLGELPFARPPTAFFISEEGMMFVVSSFSSESALDGTFLQIFSLNDLKRSVSFEFESISNIIEQGPIGFAQLAVTKNLKGEYIAFITTDTKGLMTCRIVMSEPSSRSHSIKCHEYGLNLMIKHDLIEDQTPTWNQLKVLNKVPDDPEGFKLLIAGTHTPIYIINVVLEKSLSILQGFINYDQTYEQSRVVLNSEYLVAYSVYDYLDLACLPNKYKLHVYEISEKHSVRVNLEDSWRLQEAVTRIEPEHDQLIDIDQESNKLYLYYYVSGLSTMDIVKNATICVRGDVDIPPGTQYDLMIHAKNDLGTKTYSWRFEVPNNETSGLPEPPAENKSGSLMTVVFVVLAIFVAISILAYIQRNRNTKKIVVTVASQQAVEVQTGPDYNKLKDVPQKSQNK